MRPPRFLNEPNEVVVPGTRDANARRYDAPVADDLRVNDPVVVAEVQAIFERYERALVDNEVETLVELFRDAPETVRYGIDDVQHGHDELAHFRRTQAAATMPRRLVATVITTFGDDFAVADTQFVPDGSEAIGRQSQTWVRTAQGWRVASAHVSWLGGRAP
jgi:hypothetical protein